MQKELTKWENELKTILTAQNEGRMGIASRVFVLLKESGAYAPLLLQDFYECSFLMPFDAEKQGKRLYTKKEEQNLVGKLRDSGLIQQIQDLFQKNYSKNEFYEQLWEIICNSKILKSEKQRVFILYLMWGNPRIPYFQLTDMIQFTEDDVSEELEKVQLLIAEAKYALFSRFPNRPEEAYAMVRLFDEVPTNKGKAVLLSMIIRYVELRMMNNIKNRIAREKLME